MSSVMDYKIVNNTNRRRMWPYQRKLFNFLEDFLFIAI